MNKNNDRTRATETYWSIIKTFVNSITIPVIAPLLVSNQLVSDLFVKANLCNNAFSQEHTTTVNNSSIPTNLNFKTENKLSTFEFSVGNIIKVFRLLDSNQVYGHYEIFICMTKLCISLMLKSLHIKFIYLHLYLIIEQYRYCKSVRKFLIKLFSTLFLNN